VITSTERKAHWRTTITVRFDLLGGETRIAPYAPTHAYLPEQAVVEFQRSTDHPDWLTEVTIIGHRVLKDGALHPYQNKTEIFGGWRGNPWPAWLDPIVEAARSHLAEAGAVR
jgi:hypothetical protein